MKHQSWLALGLATLLLGPTACGPRDDGRNTTPRPGDSSDPPVARSTERPPRATPPRKAARPNSAPRPAPGGVQCPPPGGPGLTAVTWPAARAHLRRYISETRLDKVSTSKATPVEVCGARGQIAWLMRARCPDGTAPFADARKAHASRSGNVGPGGRCGKVVDLYKVRCKGATYSVHMSLYHCTATERFP